MKILVTGAGGFLGRRIAERLLAHGVDWLRLQFRQWPSKEWLDGLQALYPQAHIECVTANLLAAGSLGDLVAGVDCIVHAAAGMRGATADMFANTVVGSRNLFEAAGQGGVRRITLISSYAVYRTEHLSRGAVHDESLPIESVGIEKGPYGYAKTRQEQVFAEYQKRYGFETVVLRPGVVYGPGGGAFSTRVGVNALGVFFSLGGRALLPLTYVDNCADAIAIAALKAPSGTAFNVVDDDIIRCKDYLSGYRRFVSRIRTIPVPYWALLLGSYFLVWYHRVSKGQLPAIFTPYSVRSMFRPLKYSNAALRDLGWKQRISTEKGLELTYADLRNRLVKAG
jgi:nucleoside-diphosphate-sugar epimerase